MVLVLGRLWFLALIRADTTDFISLYRLTLTPIRDMKLALFFIYKTRHVFISYAPRHTLCSHSGNQPAKTSKRQI